MQRLKDIPQGLWQQDGDLAQEITNSLTRAVFTACPALAVFTIQAHLLRNGFCHSRYHVCLNESSEILT